MPLELPVPTPEEYANAHLMNTYNLFKNAKHAAEIAKTMAEKTGDTALICTIQTVTGNMDEFALRMKDMSAALGIPEPSNTAELEGGTC